MKLPVAAKPLGSALWLIQPLILAWAVALFWLAPKPPMIDLPQHAAQIAALRDLMRHDFEWSELVRTNLFTPYLLAYGLGSILALVMPLLWVVKLLLTLAFLGFVAASSILQRALGSDSRLWMLSIPGFFGFAYKWGFLTFLLAAPLGLIFVWLAYRHAVARSVRSGWALAGSGVLLFFCHGVVFAFAVLMGSALLLFHTRSIRAIFSACWVYLLLAALAVFYVIFSADAERAQNPYAGQWGRGSELKRWVGVLVYPVGEGRNDAVLVPVVLALLGAPWIMGLRPRLRTASGVVFGTLIMVWFAFPDSALESGFLYQRFAICTLPFYAFLFAAPPPQATDSSAARRSARGSALMLVALLFFLAVQTVRHLAFGREQAAFETLSAAAEPGARALSLIIDARSPAAANDGVYQHWSVWYQAEHEGWVDPNFALFRAQVVRFKPSARPPIGIWPPASFDWDTHAGAKYRYFFVRSEQGYVPSVKPTGACPLRLLTSIERWQLFERVTCQDP